MHNLTLCHYCSKPFIPKKRDNLFCSRNCSIYSWNKRNNYKPKENKDKKREYSVRYRLENSDKISKINSNWYASNKDRARDYSSNYRKLNKEKVSSINKKWKSDNRDRISKRAKHRYNNDLTFKIKSIIRSRFRQAIKNNQKVGSAINLLGCSIFKLKIHLQLKFYRATGDSNRYMTWDNYGEWHIDHIRPLSSFNLQDIDELKQACHYTNLQPLWAKDNLKKWNKI